MSLPCPKGSVREIVNPIDLLGHVFMAFEWPANFPE